MNKMQYWCEEFERSLLHIMTSTKLMEVVYSSLNLFNTWMINPNPNNVYVNANKVRQSKVNNFVW